MKKYKWLRGLLKASAFATVMFAMQACYGAPHPMDEPPFDEETSYQETDSIQDPNTIDAEEVESQVQ